MSNQEAKQQALFKQILEKMLQEPENKWCADCHASAPRWASSKLGIFLCIKCAGIHRSMGTHISFVRSVNLDKWKDNEIQTMQEFGNKRAAMIWEATLPEGFRRPSASDGYSLEKFIRAKYASKQFYQNKTKDQLDQQEQAQPSTRREEPVAPPVQEAEQPQGRLTGNNRRPVKRPAGYTFSPPSSPPPQSPPANDFGPFQKSPPPINILSAAVNLLSLEDHQEDFGAFTPPVIPQSANLHPHSTAAASGATGVNQQAAKDSIMTMFDPTPVSTNAGWPASYGYSNGYSAPINPATYQYGYTGSPQLYHSPTGSPAGYASPGGYTGSPGGYSSPAAGYYGQSPAYSSGYAPQVTGQPQWPAATQPAYDNSGAAFDPLLHKIQSISQEKRPDGSVSGSGLATLLI